MNEEFPEVVIPDSLDWLNSYLEEEKLFYRVPNYKVHRLIRIAYENEQLKQQVIDYETDWRKMRKYYDGAMEKMKMLDEAIEVIGFYADTDNWLEEKDRNNLYTIIMNDASDDFDDLLRFGGKRAREFLVKIKRN